ncbi:MAG: hypothetical protein OXJ64_02320 [Boseongicola sp.]|nr:hypothetical protein [Boseongicola sp.]
MFRFPSGSPLLSRQPLRHHAGRRLRRGAPEQFAFGRLPLTSPGGLFSVGRILDTELCTASSDRRNPVFIDPDGDELTVTAVVPNAPDNVRFLRHTPLLHFNRDRVFVSAAAAGSDTDVRINLTATDPHGASVSTFFFVQAHVYANTAKPRFDRMVGVRGFPRNRPIPRWVLPPPTRCQHFMARTCPSLL